MLEASPHRGSEIETFPLGRVVVGFARGDAVGMTQAFSTDDLRVVFSGYLDNRAALWSELGRDLDLDPDAGPAEIIGSLWPRGEVPAPMLRGVYQVLVSDGRELWAFRDHLGSRPLFFRADGSSVCVGAEAKQVVAGSGIRYEPDQEIIENIYYGRRGAPERCALRGVVRLLPAHILRANEESHTVHRYWNPESFLETARYQPDELQERFDALLTQAVDRCLVGDDVVALSGGIDSPAIAAYGAPLYRERYGRPLPALSAVYPDQPAVDESEYIRAVAEELGMPLHTYVSEARPTDRILDWVQLVDSPIPVISLSESLEHLVLAGELGYRNSLTGEIAEYVVDMRGPLLDHLLTHGRIRAAWHELEQRRLQGETRSKRVRRVLRAFIPLKVRLWRWQRRATRLPEVVERRRPPWLSPDQLKPAPPVSARKGWLDGQVSAFGGATLASEADDGIQSIAGVTTRRPWADIDLWQFFLSLRAETKFPRLGKKPLVRDLLRGRVPDLILDRRDKTYFDDAIFDRIDYPHLERWLLEPHDFRMPGVDYAAVAERIRNRELDLWEYFWVKDLAAVHAFLSTC